MKNQLFKIKKFSISSIHAFYLTSRKGWPGASLSCVMLHKKMKKY